MAHPQAYLRPLILRLRSLTLRPSLLRRRILDLSILGTLLRRHRLQDRLDHLVQQLLTTHRLPYKARDLCQCRARRTRLSRPRRLTLLCRLHHRDLARLIRDLQSTTEHSHLSQISRTRSQILQAHRVR